jgi:hypothetical protein
VQLLLDYVTLLKVESDITMNIRFKGGLIQRIRTKIPPKAWLQKKTDESIVKKFDDLLEHHTVAEIVKILNSNDMKGGYGKSFRRWTVNRIIESHSLRTRFERLRDRGMLTPE